MGTDFGSEHLEFDYNFALCKVNKDTINQEDINKTSKETWETQDLGHELILKGEHLTLFGSC